MGCEISDQELLEYIDKVLPGGTDYLRDFGMRFAGFSGGQQIWSKETFGPKEDRGPIGPLKHLAKEAVECHEAYGTPNFEEELADCLFLLNDAVWRSGMTWTRLLQVAQAKLEKNKARTWPEPTKGDEPVEHDRSKDGCCGCDGPLGTDGGCEPCMAPEEGPPVESEYEYIRAEIEDDDDESYLTVFYKRKGFDIGASMAHDEDVSWDDDDDIKGIVRSMLSLNDAEVAQIEIVTI